MENIEKKLSEINLEILWANHVDFCFFSLTSGKLVRRPAARQLIEAAGFSFSEILESLEEEKASRISRIEEEKAQIAAEKAKKRAEKRAEDARKGVIGYREDWVTDDNGDSYIVESPIYATPKVEKDPLDNQGILVQFFTGQVPGFSIESLDSPAEVSRDSKGVLWIETEDGKFQTTWKELEERAGWEEPGSFQRPRKYWGK